MAHLRCVKQHDMSLVANLLMSPILKILKIGQHLSELWTNIEWPVFIVHSIAYIIYAFWSQKNILATSTWSQVQVKVQVLEVQVQVQVQVLQSQLQVVKIGT